MCSTKKLREIRDIKNRYIMHNMYNLNEKESSSTPYSCCLSWSRVRCALVQLCNVSILRNAINILRWKTKLIPIKENEYYIDTRDDVTLNVTPKERREVDG